MILRSLCAECWRCFVNQVKVGPFGDGLNVIHGPNASGKSTLFEALLRGLMESHRVSGREVEALRPWGRLLSPRVEIEFRHAGVEYRLVKSFLERAGSELMRVEGGRFIRLAEGAAADETVRKMLTRNPPGKGLSRPSNWGYAQVLWAPQGNLSLSRLSGDLVSDIRESLGAQLGGKDTGPLEEKIEESYLQIYTPTGKLKTGKDAPPLVKMTERLHAAREKRRIAQERQSAFEDAIRRVEDLRLRRAHLLREIEELSTSRNDLRAKTDAFTEMLSKRDRQKERLKAAEAQWQEITQRVEAIRIAREELNKSSKALSRLREDLPLREREVEVREKDAAGAKASLEDVRKGAREVGVLRREAEDARMYIENREKLSELEKRFELIGLAEEKVRNLGQERSAFIAPDTKALQAIRKAMRDRDNAQVRLEASLITLEMVPESEGVLDIVSGEETGHESFSPGKPVRIKGSPEVVMDVRGVGRFRAWGPTGSVDTVKRARNDAVERLKRLTQVFGTEDLEELERLSEKAGMLDKKLNEANTHLEALLSGASPESLRREHAGISAILDSIIKDHPHWVENQPDVNNLLRSAEQIEQSYHSNLARKEKEWEASHTALTAAATRKAEVSVKLDGAEKQVRSLHERLLSLTQDGRSDEDRQAELQRCRLAFEASIASIDEIEAGLKAFGEDPRQTLIKLEKRLKEVEILAGEALAEEKRAEGRLEELSAQGPYSALAQAEEEIAQLEAELSREQLKADAIRLLRDTFVQCSSELVAEVAKPVEQAAAQILRRVAGSRLGPVRINESFEPVELLHELSGACVPLDSASGGEKEQVYIATRLALAELLARDGRQLLVLDDVLTATDAARLSRISTILEEASEHLQILVITCHPERYRGLDGAIFFDLEKILELSES